MKSIAVSPYKQITTVFYQDHRIRTFLDDNDRLWIMLTDVGRAIGRKTIPELARYVRPEERGKFCIGPQGFSWFATERGLSDYLSRSLKEAARPFLAWLVAEVWPSLRRQGIRLVSDDDRTKKSLGRQGVINNDPISGSQNIVPFSFKGHDIRIMCDDNGEPWWVANDVCSVLGLVNPRDTMARLDPDEKGVGIADTLGGPQEMTIINDPGLWHLIFLSRRPEAKALKRWVWHEVLPAIRKTGSYSLRGAALS